MLNEVKARVGSMKEIKENKKVISFCSFATVRARSDFLPSASHMSH